jgi:TPP-dependent indolepyruvate ferredoxin oxidoreductase alpha subunit
MSEEEFEEDAEPELEEEDLPEEDLEVDALDEDLDDDLVLDDDLAVDDALVVEDVAAVIEPDVDAKPVAAVVAPSGDDEDEDVVDLDEELHPDDVEAPLDALLEEKTAAQTLEDEEEDLEDDEPEGDDRGEGPARIVPRRADEFVCRSCFLVLPRHQLADEERMLCRDCA